MSDQAQASSQSIALEERVDPGDAIRGLVETYTAEWITEHSPEKIREFVWAKLDSCLEATMTSGMGFSRSFGRWEVDHCNGRESAVSQYMRSQAADAVQGWLNKQTKKLKLPTKQLQGALAREFDEQFKRALRDKVQQQATKAADDIFDQVIQQVLGKVQNAKLNSDPFEKKGQSRW